MSKLIIICGSEGTGKTTLAKALSKNTGLVCLSKDSIKAALYDELDFQTADTYKLFHNLVEEQIKNHANLIVEATFTYQGNVDMVQTWYDTYDFELYWIVCDIDNKKRIERIQHRKRHPSHAEADKKTLKNSTHPTPDFSHLPGHSMRLTTDKPVELLVDDVIEFLGLTTISPKENKR